MLFSLFVEKEESQKLTYLKELGEDGEYKYV
ncbi:phage head morphogenesis protein, partial [Staphylococcus aureus]|nr:phage head morphogenesis protein [Staphylococcus aureus]MCB4415508.1 phage head morphogenesis protein [Staphylococcus aureus]MCB4415728.1 phage head morphogenesis protein [Staphylococcus aureus]MCB4421181.1 phage head morphogenesis protein [Staphylococcus aureus]